jgi:hypothetical protein
VWCLSVYGGADVAPSLELIGKKVQTWEMFIKECDWEKLLV